MDLPLNLILVAVPVLLFAWICWSRFFALLRRPGGEWTPRHEEVAGRIEDRLRARRFMGLEYPEACPPWRRQENDRG
jgi:hypothetical protein